MMSNAFENATSPEKQSESLEQKFSLIRMGYRTSFHSRTNMMAGLVVATGATRNGKHSSHGEVETIIQRGTSYCCTGCKIDDEGKLEVEIAITGQKAKKLDW